ncbi:hypothetical protein PFLUV_G00269440 [Perca fluviatilis]|uniref:Uncharacterized protein n=1 Tax=Perca fluviatilis TaxID=8168 RepID=A0A6A5E6V4_PERFL|nr:hypothetical protein PFLUV_G00269440 [Perca fluviatilis]
MEPLEEAVVTELKRQLEDEDLDPEQKLSLLNNTLNSQEGKKRRTDGDPKQRPKDSERIDFLYEGQMGAADPGKSLSRGGSSGLRPSEATAASGGLGTV